MASGSSFVEKNEGSLSTTWFCLMQTSLRTARAPVVVVDSCAVEIVGPMDRVESCSAPPAPPPQWGLFLHPSTQEISMWRGLVPGGLT